MYYRSCCCLLEGVDEIVTPIPAMVDTCVLPHESPLCHEHHQALHPAGLPRHPFHSRSLSPKLLVVTCPKCLKQFALSRSHLGCLLWDLVVISQKV